LPASLWVSDVVKKDRRGRRGTRGFRVVQKKHVPSLQEKGEPKGKKKRNSVKRKEERKERLRWEKRGTHIKEHQ